MITVYFDCPLCGVVRGKGFAPNRGRNESIVHWIGVSVMGVVGLAHSLLSPNCRPKTLSNIVFQVPKDGRIGDEPEEKMDPSLLSNLTKL